ncbi:Pentatricopeptide repeat [Dillenia turbinata]|uniref:Pentatricopeptide repeat n=1 Tax=Dillenia turbinata TaxID=194707 RepID=A0AAN8VVJ4_9MAGN
MLAKFPRLPTLKRVQIKSSSQLIYRAHFCSTKISRPRKDGLDGGAAHPSWLITKLSKEGGISEARKSFDKMPECDVITWTAMISGYTKCGMLKEARRLFDRVDAKKDAVTWRAMVSGYLRWGQILEAEKLFNDMPDKNVVEWNKMINGYAQNGQIDSAYALFEKMPERNVVSWNAMLTAFVQSGRIEEARKIFDRMPVRNVISWTAMLSGLSKHGRIDEARALFNRMPQRNVVSWNAMITGYGQNSRLHEALYLFERMPERNVSSWNIMISGFIQNGDLVGALKLYNEMPCKNVVSWTTMMSGFIDNELSEEALKMFSSMLAMGGVKPNQGTFVTVLSACTDLACACEGQQIHQIICKTVYQNDSLVVSSLIKMYSRCGDLGTARKMFDDQSIDMRDLICWNGMIAAYAYHGQGREAIQLFREMQILGFKPNDVTYIVLLSACSHAGLVEEGLKYFDELVKNHSVQSREDHYACVVDLCSRAGRLAEAVDLIRQLGAEPSAPVWGALLTGCILHGDVGIAKLAADKLLEVEPDYSGHYKLLCNIYASQGKFREASEVWFKMKEKGLKRQPGCSWIEVGNIVHVFIAGDKSHYLSNVIFFLLHDLHIQMKKSGHVSHPDIIEGEDFFGNIIVNTLIEPLLEEIPRRNSIQITVAVTLPALGEKVMTSWITPPLGLIQDEFSCISDTQSLRIHYPSFQAHQKTLISLTASAAESSFYTPLSEIKTGPCSTAAFSVPISDFNSWFLPLFVFRRLLTDNFTLSPLHNKS